MHFVASAAAFFSFATSNPDVTKLILIGGSILGLAASFGGQFHQDQSRGGYQEIAFVGGFPIGVRAMVLRIAGKVRGQRLTIMEEQLG